MRECGRHSLESQPGGGVCARCVEERLRWLWRGESFRAGEELAASSQNPPDAAAGSTTVAESSREPAAGASGEVHVKRDGGGLSGDEDGACVLSERDLGPGNSTLRNSTSVMEEWTAFHARRRRSVERARGDGELGSPKSKSFDSIEAVVTEPDRAPVGTENVRNPQLVILMNAQKMRSRSMPLDNRSAEDTAQRVINEQADDLFLDALDAYGIVQQDRDGGGNGEALHEAQRCFSPQRWQSRKSPKWVKVLVSPMMSRNRVFPSRSKEDARRGRGLRKRGRARFASSDWSLGKDSAPPHDSSGSSPQWMASPRPQASNPRSTMRSSVFSWLQSADAKYDPREQVTSPSSSSSSLTNSVSTDSWLRDLTTVGHLHEIAEELEIVEESSEEEEDDDMGDISSFGKFLLLAAQRHPDARLTRLVSADSNRCQIDVQP